MLTDREGNATISEQLSFQRDDHDPMPTVVFGHIDREPTVPHDPPMVRPLDAESDLVRPAVRVDPVGRYIGRCGRHDSTLRLP